MSIGDYFILATNKILKRTSQKNKTKNVKEVWVSSLNGDQLRYDKFTAQSFTVSIYIKHRLADRRDEKLN